MKHGFTIEFEAQFWTISIVAATHEFKDYSG